MPESEMLPQELVEKVLGEDTAERLWTKIYWPVLPVNPQSFALGSVLPALWYLLRFGRRRGRGKFNATYGRNPQDREISALDVARKLQGPGWSQRPPSEIGADVIADFLLASAFEVRGRSQGRSAPVQRVYPSHYFACWVDLPYDAAHLRYVPEMLAALLRTQPAYREQRDPFAGNPVLALFGQGVQAAGQPSGDQLSRDAAQLGADQLLIAAVARQLEVPPEPAGKPPRNLRRQGESAEISGQLPLSQRGSEVLLSTLRAFFEGWAKQLPRLLLAQQSEFLIGLGLLQLLGCTASSLEAWSEKGLPEDAPPLELLLDCSGGSRPELRQASEESLELALQRYLRLPETFMLLRVLEDAALDSALDLPPAEPRAVERLRVLGDLLFGRHPRSDEIRIHLRRSCARLRDHLKGGGYEEALGYLQESLARSEGTESGEPLARGLARALCSLQGKDPGARLLEFWDSAGQAGLAAPQALLAKRSVQRLGRKAEARSALLSNLGLDALVHLRLQQGPCSLAEFTGFLAERYGLLVDRAPAGLDLPQSLLLQNRADLEGRLRHLGLLTSVNDAETMKMLSPRYQGAA